MNQDRRNRRFDFATVIPWIIGTTCLVVFLISIGLFLYFHIPSIVDFTQTNVIYLFSSFGIPSNLTSDYQTIWASTSLIIFLGMAFFMDWRRRRAENSSDLPSMVTHSIQDLSILDHIREGIGIIHIQNHSVLYANQPLLDIFQVPDGDSLDIFSMLEKDTVIDLIQHLSDHNQFDYKCISQGQTWNGNYLWLDLQISKIELEGGPAGMLVIRDITLQKQSEESLQSTKQRYNSLLDTTRHQAQELQLINQVRLALANEIDAQAVFAKVGNSIAQICGYPLVSIYLVHDDELVLQHQIGYTNLFTTIKITKGICGRVVRTGKAVLVKDVSLDPDFLASNSKICSEICIPLFDEGKVVGILNAETDGLPPLNEEDLCLLTEICHNVEFAINRARLYTEAREAAERLRRQNDYLEILHETTLGVINRQELDDLVNNIIQRSCQMLQTDHGYVYQFKPEENVLEVTHGVGIYRDFIGFHLEPGDGLAGKVFLSGKTMIIEDYQVWEGRSIVFPPNLFHAALGIPLRNGEEIIGVLGITHLTKEKYFKPGEIEIAERFGQLASLSIGNARLHTVTQQELAIRQQIQEALRISEERYELVIRGANDGFWDWDLRTGKIFYSPRWKAMLGWDEEMIQDTTEEWFSRVHPDDLVFLKEDIDKHLNGETKHLECEHRMLHRNGDYRWVLVRGLAVREQRHSAHRIAGSLTDITPSKLAQERLLHDAMHDPLTGLPNRLYFMDQIRLTLERCRRRPDHQAAVLSMDLDRFKLVNDSLGHSYGDQMLVAVARRLENCLRAGDIIARFGGDEFAILIDDIIDVQDAIRVANRVQSELSHPFSLKGHEIFTSVSIGIAISSPLYQEPEEIYRDADTALYQAKYSGRSRHQIFENEMHASSMALFKLEADLRRAIERNEFILYYQPIVSLNSGRITSLEVLIRWLNPERGLVPPDEFISMAEETGLIVPIGEYVLYTACAQARTWYDQGNTDIRIAINLSARQLQDPRLPELVREVLEKTGLPAVALHLEITESAAMKDFDLTVQTLTEIRKMGVQFSIDDFGTSYSSLDYLKRFPVSSIKIDRSFIRDLVQDPDDAAITAAIIAMGHILNLNLIAEGVENPEQLSFLNQQSCDECQGFLFSRPVPADNIPALLAQRRNLVEDHITLPERHPDDEPPVIEIRE